MNIKISKIFLLSILLNVSCVLFPGYALLASPNEKETISIVKNKKPLACIVISPNLNKNLKEAAKCLGDYIYKSTEARLKAQNEKSEDLINIYIGNNSYNKICNIKFSDPEEFAIFFPDNKTIVLTGGSPAGTEYAIYEFLERYIGVRWLFPGELGECVPSQNSINILKKTVCQRPAFLFRHFYGIGEAAQRIWLRRMRINCHDKYKHLESHHNLSNLFPVKLFAETHPEFYPLRNGKRFIPPQNTYSWQPCFSAKGSADAAAERICQFFSEHPEAVSYSLGVNDNAGHCRCQQCRAKVPAKKNEIGQDNYSQLYYPWANKVIEKVRTKYPDKYFGCLAYNRVFSPPAGIKLNDHFIPMIVFERYQWVDKNIKQKIQEINQDWEKSADVLGWYDYIYGKPYLIPRIWFHPMAEYLRYAYEHNVRYYVAEAPQKFDWREGPKLYLTAKLLWNPYSDADAILSEWYRLAVGKKAAPYMKQYFDFLENFWCSKIPKTSWFKTGAGKLYLDFNNDGYRTAMNMNDIDKCDKILRMMLDSAGTIKQKQRAKHYYNTFIKWSKNVCNKLQDKAIDTINLIPEDSLKTDKHFWRLRGKIIHENKERIFCSRKKSYIILSGDINVEKIKAELIDSSFEFKLKAKGVDNPFFGVCILAMDKNKKYIDDGKCKKYFFWNITLREKMNSFIKKTKVKKLINNKNLKKIKYLRVVFYNISCKDKPDSQISIKDISLYAKKYKAPGKINYELIQNGNFVSGTDNWKTRGKIIVDNGKNILRFNENAYIILLQKIKRDDLHNILSKFSPWRLKIKARGNDSPRIGLIIQGLSMGKSIKGCNKTIFWNVPLNNQMDEIIRKFSMDFITGKKDCDVNGLRVILYRCDFKSNPSGQIDIESISLSPLKKMAKNDITKGEKSKPGK